MLFRMLRTQTSEHGTLRMGIAYDAGKNPALLSMAKGMIEAELAEEVTAKQLADEKVKAEKLAAASVKPAKGGKTAKDTAELDAALAAAEGAKAEADQAKAEAATAKAEAEALKQQLADLEKQLDAAKSGQDNE